MKATSIIHIMALAVALVMPMHMRSQQVQVNVGDAPTDSVIVTVTVKVPRPMPVAAVRDTVIVLSNAAVADTVVTAANAVIVAEDSAGASAPIIIEPAVPVIVPAAHSVESTPAFIDRHKHPVVRKNTLPDNRPEMYEKVIVKGDTVNLVIPTRNYGRYDRGLFNYLYLVKGSWQLGLSTSYGEFSTEDVQVLSMLKDVDFKGKLYSLKPWVSYCFHNNQTIGMRLNYTKGSADLANLAVDIDDDMNFELHDVSYYSQSYSLGVFYRNYVGLSRSKRFAVFNEVALEFSSGSSRFKRYYNDELSDTRTVTRGGSLNFSPGVCVFIHENIAFNVSFGVFGLKFNKETQTTNGVDEGSRFSSGANFKFNIFNINLGLMVVI